MRAAASPAVRFFTDDESPDRAVFSHDDHGLDKDALLHLALTACNTCTELEGEKYGNVVELEMTNVAAQLNEKVRAAGHEVLQVDTVRRFEFDTAIQLQSVIVQIPTHHEHCTGVSTNTSLKHSTTHLLLTKGAPAKVAARCSHDSLPGDFELVTRQLARQGKYILAVAARTLPHSSSIKCGQREEFEHDLTFVGLICFANALKPDTELMIGCLRNAAIKPVMVTGDNVYSGTAIAGRAGLFVPGSSAGSSGDREGEDVPGDIVVLAEVNAGGGSSGERTSDDGGEDSFLWEGIRWSCSSGAPEGVSVKEVLRMFFNKHVAPRSAVDPGDGARPDDDGSATPAGALGTRQRWSKLSTNSRSTNYSAKRSTIVAVEDIWKTRMFPKPVPKTDPLEETVISFGKRDDKKKKVVFTMTQGAFEVLQARENREEDQDFGPLFEDSPSTSGKNLEEDSAPSILSVIFADTVVFGSMTPHGKIAVIDYWQTLHPELVIGMMGDGGNDFGALRQAHVGLSLTNREDVHEDSSSDHACSEVSILSPFSADCSTPLALVEIIKEGRCALVNRYVLSRRKGGTERIGDDCVPAVLDCRCAFSGLGEWVCWWVVVAVHVRWALSYLFFSRVGAAQSRIMIIRKNGAGCHNPPRTIMCFRRTARTARAEETCLFSHRRRSF